MVGLVFLSEGIQKFLFPAELGAGRFTKPRVPFPDKMGYVIRAIEIAGGLLLLFRCKVRYAMKA